MAPSRDDVLNRIYVGQGFTFKADGGPEKLVEALEPLLERHPDMLALLEFTSPGHEKRQIDCALLGPGGIDLIEVKNHRGLIQISADGVWTVQSGNRKVLIGNIKAGRSENPYDQAYNAADDLKGGIKKDFGQEIRVTPLVFLPSADARSKVVKHFNVDLALGPRNLSQALRSAPRTQDGWKGLDYRTLPQKLGLTPIRLSFLMGRVASAATHQGIEHLEVIAEVNGEQQVTTTDAGGHYSLCVRLGSSVSLGYAVPGQFETPAVITLQADHRILKVPDIQLGLKPPLKTEAEIRDELEQEMYHRLQEQARQTETAWNSAQVRFQVVLDDITQQLYQLQVQLNERERQLRQYQQGAAPLVARVLQQGQVLAVEEQRAEVAYALERLKHSDNAQQQDTFRQSMALISRLTGELRQPLPTTAPSVVHVRAEARAEASLESVSETSASEPAVQVTKEQAPETAVVASAPATKPSITSSKVPSTPETVAVASVPAKRPPWVWPVAAAILLVGLLGIWGTVRSTTAPSHSAAAWAVEDSEDGTEQEGEAETQGEQAEAEVTAPVTSDLPGEVLQKTGKAMSQQGTSSAVPASSTAQGTNGLPGEPLR